MKNTIVRSLLFWILFDALLYGLSHLAALVPTEWSRLLQAVLGVSAGFILIWIFLKREKRTFKDVGLVWEMRSLSRFLLGVLIGTVLIALVVFVLVSFTDLQIKRSSNEIHVQTWLKYLVVIILFAFMEELIFRSYAFLELCKTYGLLWAQIIAAIVFALYHVVSGWSWQASFLGPFIWAFVFGMAAILSRGIALPTGIHAALNILQVLTGMKADKASLWTFELKKNYAAGASVNRVGLLIQIFILIAGLVATYIFVQKKKKEGGKSDEAYDYSISDK